MDENIIRLLIVDDEVGFADVVAKRLSRRGFTVDTANSGEEAIPVLREKQYDVAVLDLKLEGMDGVEILKVFKLMVPDMPVIMLTGHGSQSAVTASQKLGVADYLSKPVDLDLLVEKLRKVCALKAGERD